MVSLYHRTVKREKKATQRVAFFSKEREKGSGDERGGKGGVRLVSSNLDILPYIDDFQCMFNHLPRCLTRKTPACPVLGYYREEDFIRIDMFSPSRFPNPTRAERRFQVTSVIGSYTVNLVFQHVDEAYAFIVDYLYRNRLRFL